MSGYWSTTSGTALIIPKEEAKDFFTKRQSWMLPDLSVQRKTPNGPKLKSLTYCVICYIMYIS